MAKATPKISVIERRLQGPSVFRTSSQPVPMKDPNAWKVRWENTKISPDQLWNALHVKGWDYVMPDDLDCPVEEIGAQARDGRVVRGERGEEVLLKMAMKDYTRLEQHKTKETLKQTFGQQQLKKTIVDQVAGEHGDRAADFMQKQVNTITVQDSRVPEDQA